MDTNWVAWVQVLNETEWTAASDAVVKGVDIKNHIAYIRVIYILLHDDHYS